MKNINKTKSLFLVLGLACITSFFITCKSPVENILVTVSADYVTAPSEFRIFDAATGNSETAFEGVSVKITGAAEASAYSSGGSKTLLINNGILQVCFRKGTVASETNPLKFNIEIKVSGYLPKIYPVKLTSINPVVESIFLVNTNNLPKGTAKISSSTITDNTGTTTAAVTVTLPTNANKTEVAELTIPAGVTMKDKDGNPVTGTVAIDVLQFAGNGQQALDAFGNKGNNTINEINGNALTETVIAPLGWLNINMTAGGKEVKTFSSPVKGKIGIPAGLVNPITGAEYKEGDAISLLSKEDDGTEFKKESTATLQKATDGSLFVEINITHLSGWTVAQILEKCSVKYEVNISDNNIDRSKSKAESNGISLLDELLDGSSFSQVKITYYKANGEEYYKEEGLHFNIEGSDIDLTTKKAVFTIPVQNLAPVQIFSGQISLSYDFWLDVTIPKANNPCQLGTIVAGPSTTITTVTAKFRAKCTSGSSNYVVLPEGFKLYYIKESDYNSNGNPVLSNAIWKSTTLSVSADKAFNKITINKTDLTGGGAYRFAVSYDGKRYDYVYTVANPVPDDISIELSIPCK